MEAKGIMAGKRAAESKAENRKLKAEMAEIRAFFSLIAAGQRSKVERRPAKLRRSNILQKQKKP